MITIDQKYLNDIKFVLAYPKLKKVILTDDEIKEFCVWPALQLYFTKFPKQSIYSATVVGGGEIVVDFESEQTYGILDCRIVDAGVGYPSGDSFWDLYRFQQIGGATFSTKGAYNIPGYNPNGYSQTQVGSLQLQKSIQKVYSTIKYRVDHAERKLYVYSSTSGKLNVTWANFSTNFADVKFNIQREVIMLAQAELLEHLANTADIITDSTLDISFNTDALESKAEKLRDKVKEKWDSYPTVMVLHN